MKVNLYSSTALMTENEKNILLQFQTALQNACDDIPFCSDCPMSALCKGTNAPELFSAILAKLNIF